MVFLLLQEQATEQNEKLRIELKEKITKRLLEEIQNSESNLTEYNLINLLNELRKPAVEDVSSITSNFIVRFPFLCAKLNISRFSLTLGKWMTVKLQQTHVKTSNLI